MIAQTWDPEVIYGFGDRIGTEMTEFGVTLWLAPGMNIHRNALCGRNFEYYSEDPLIAGLTAGYTTLGVQSHPGVGVTLKHYAVNSQETSRNSENNTVSERALREIYLKGFEIAVKMAQPMAIMTSYNQNNSMPAADDYDLCTDIPRGEWGFNGLIMTDWGGGQSTPVNSMHAGNDLIMPGGSSASIRNMFQDVEPTFDQSTGYVTITGSGRRQTENWGTFVLNAEGSKEFSVTVAANVDVAGNRNIAPKVTAGTAVITENADGTKTVTYKGDFSPNALPLGDLQKAAAHVLNVIMNSAQFEKITKEYEGDVITVGSFTEKYADQLRFAMDSGVNRFVDVPNNAWYAPYVTDVDAMGIMKGVDEDHFSPDNNIKRGDFVLMLYRMVGEPDVSDLQLQFTDVQRDYYKDAIKWAADAGIVKGTSETTFSPEKSITREQIATILYRWVGEPEVEDKLAGFEDGVAVSDYAKSAMNWAIANGVITGSQDTVTGKILLKPAASASRAQIAAIIDRSLPLLAE